jgi:hypothetical protein
MPPNGTKDVSPDAGQVLSKRLVIQALEVGESTEEKEPLGFVHVDDHTTVAQLRGIISKLIFGKGTPAGEEERPYDIHFQTAMNGSEGIWCKIDKNQEKTEYAASLAPVLQVRIAKKEKKKEQIETEEKRGFEVSTNTVTGCDGVRREINKIILKPESNNKSSELLTQLRKIMRESNLYDREPAIPVESLFDNLTAIKKLASQSEVVGDLLQEIESLKEQELKKFDRLKEEGVVTFSYLQHCFPTGMKICTTRRGMDEQYIGGEVISSRVVNSYFSNYLEVCYYVIKSNGKRFARCQERATISAFMGTKKISDMPIYPMTPEMQAQLEERGRKFAKVCLGAHYLSYTGSLIQDSWCGPVYLKAAGRVMVDGVSFERNNPSSRLRLNSDDGDTLDGSTVNEEQFYMCWPTLMGFSFAAKKWGEIDLQYVEPIQFDDNAFESLVLAPEKKDLVKGLVCNYQTGFGDIISGKGGGCIFLLHGAPGTGKTLTAEAIAELLHRPLYSVSVGELGTDTTSLEKSLREILEVASAWNAVVLLDEADIFLEKRTENDIARNAMVGIFLRLLEYHQGVMFLTTNRVKSFDSAFHSRISVALRYPALAVEDRAKVWANLLKAAGVEGLSPELLAGYELNGRQIKTTIRLAQALAHNHSVPVAAEHISQTVEVARQFNDDLAI